MAFVCVCVPFFDNMKGVKIIINVEHLMCFGSLETDLCHSNTTASSENTDITEKMLLKKKKDRKSNNKKQIIV